MLNVSEAREVAAGYLKRSLGPRYGDKILIMDEYTLERPRGWIFFYQHSRWIKSRKARDGLVGNGPVFIDKETKKIVQFGSSGSEDYWYELYKNGRTCEDDFGVVHLLFVEDIEARQKSAGE